MVDQKKSENTRGPLRNSPQQPGSVYFRHVWVTCIQSFVTWWTQKIQKQIVRQSHSQSTTTGNRQPATFGNRLHLLYIYIYIYWNTTHNAINAFFIPNKSRRQTKHHCSSVAHSVIGGGGYQLRCGSDWSVWYSRCRCSGVCQKWWLLFYIFDRFTHVLFPSFFVASWLLLLLLAGCI